MRFNILSGVNIHLFLMFIYTSVGCAIIGFHNIEDDKFYYHLCLFFSNCFLLVAIIYLDFFIFSNIVLFQTAFF